MKELVKQYDELAARLDAINEEMNPLKQLKEQIETDMELIKNQLKSDMIGMNLQKCIVGNWRISVNKGYSTVIEEPDLIPDKFLKIVKQPDLMKIKAHLKGGFELQGANMIETKSVTLKRE
jgi:hypothetical protein